ncbi:MAG: hypothetical protein HN975_10725 [Anaerolineae bacterium]|jgi:hypothetical protein|nr:hypothetical protein [Anaerolineae bacterium]
MTDDILQLTEELLGAHIGEISHRGWATFWCPFHDDKKQAGTTGLPNFGVNVDEGNWNCFRCGKKGGSIRSLYKDLGEDFSPRGADYSPVVPRKPRARKYESEVDRLDEAIADTRNKVISSPAMHYLHSRGITPYTALLYGLGYGRKYHQVSNSVEEAAIHSALLHKRYHNWFWAGSVVYADPPIQPTVLNVRYLPEETLPPKTRPFKIRKNHRTWGDRLVPLGSWRIKPDTKTIIVVEGLFDMLAGAQTTASLYPQVVVVYTNGSNPSFHITKWFEEHPQYHYLLIPDPDKAGTAWLEQVSRAIYAGGGSWQSFPVPRNFDDPDEAFLAGCPQFYRRCRWSKR